LIEVHDICFEDPIKLLLLEDQEVIQAFSPRASQEAFTDGIRSRRSERRSKDFDATRGCYSCEFQPKLAVIIPNQVSWSFSIRIRLSQLLRHPRIRRRSGHIHMNDLSRLQFDDEEGEKWTKEEILHLQIIANPYLCRMIAQKDLPCLSMSALWTDLLHILLDRPFTHSTIQLEEFPADALGRLPQCCKLCVFISEGEDGGGLAQPAELSRTGRQLLRGARSASHREATGSTAAETGVRGFLEISSSCRLISIFQKSVLSTLLIYFHGRVINWPLRMVKVFC
jgi:hypothetical protein